MYLSRLFIYDTLYPHLHNLSKSYRNKHSGHFHIVFISSYYGGGYFYSSTGGGKIGYESTFIYGSMTLMIETGFTTNTGTAGYVYLEINKLFVWGEISDEIIPSVSSIIRVNYFNASYSSFASIFNELSQYSFIEVHTWH